MVDRAPNLHTVYMSGQPLGVECVCGRRTLLSHAQLGGCKVT
jgi:DNA-directed RNA polymerase subunit N (RpoN/RPB10)